VVARQGLFGRLGGPALATALRDRVWLVVDDAPSWTRKRCGGVSFAGLLRLELRTAPGEVAGAVMILTSS
jgi:hypothetical protein